MPSRKRTNFTNNQKSAIFGRDRATCAFSGVSLWIPDQGLTPEWDNDWADHLKPSARGGTSTLDNGACVSSTFNIKKRDNGSDNLCFFHNGWITRDYVRVFGLPDDQLLCDLRRREVIVASDWWFNRAIGNSLVALDWRIRELRGLPRHTRDDTYYMRCALKQHAQWLRRREPGTYASRGLDNPSAFASDKLLALESVATELHYREWLESIWPSYRATAALLHAFDAAVNDTERSTILDAVGSDAGINTDVLDALRCLSEANDDIYVRAA